MVLSPGAGRTSAAGGLPFWSPACPFTLASILPPSPRPPSPPGKGETKGYFMQGASPLASPGLNPGGTGSTCPGGEDHLKRRSSSPPVPPSPWLPALPIERRFYRFCAELAKPKAQPPAGHLYGRNCKCRRRFNAGVPGAEPLASPRLNPRGTSYPRRLRPRRGGGVPPRGTCTAGTVSAANGLMQGCRGRSPRRNKLIVSPFPAGEGGRGDRGQNQSKRQGRQATKKASPPFGHRKPPPTHHVTPQKKRQKKARNHASAPIPGNHNHIRE